MSSHSPMKPASGKSPRLRLLFPLVCGLILAIPFIPFAASGQLSERPGSSTDTTRGPKDLTGRSIKEKRVRIVHSTDSALEGTSLYFQEKDPWLAYQRGKDLTQRSFRRRDGVFGQEGSFFGRLTSDRVTPKLDRDHATSCAICHNVPYRDAGAGINIAKNGGEGRNTPHFFGGGLVEMIGLQARLKVLALCDPDHRGYVPKEKVPARPVRIRPAPDEPEIEYGKCGDNDGDGRPDLNKIFRVWYVDASGKRVFDDLNHDGEVNLRDPDVAGYNFEMAVFGWGDVTGAMTATLRAFFAEPSDTHAGMQAYDPTTNDNDGSGLARRSNAGAQQFALHATPDRGLMKNPLGISLDDPDGDGSVNEISEGDLDIAEWYMLHAPSPAVGRQTPKTVRGRDLLRQWNCIGCHTPDWAIERGDPENPDRYLRYDGDRRFFNLEVSFHPRRDRLEGRVVPLYRVEPKASVVKAGDRVEPKASNIIVPRRAAFTVKGIYSDFKHHDLGPAFHETQFDGSLIRAFRTAPLWGVGSTAPYGHDGKNLSLDEVIRRHGGEAESSAQFYRRAAAADREALVAFLSSLVLYQTDTLPADLDGDGSIQDHFRVAGKDTGQERFNAEYRFVHPCEIEGPVTLANGEKIVSYACVNVAEAYGEELRFARDRDNDGFPDVTDPCPTTTGYLEGCRSFPTGAPAVPPRWVPIGGPDGGVVNVIAFDPRDPGTVYAGLDGGGVYKSADGGLSWRTSNTGLRRRDVMAIAIHPTNPRILYVGTSGGVYQSRDGGGTWSPVNEGIDEPVIMSLAIHPRSPDIVYAGTMKGIYRSVNGGAGWERLHGGLPHHAHVHGFILDAGQATTPSLDQRPSEILYVALEGDGVYQSIDRGDRWYPVNRGLDSLDIRALAQDPEVPSILYAGGLNGKIYKSTDGGDHWTWVNRAAAGPPVNALLIHPADSRTVYAAIEGKGVYRSADGGQQWEHLAIAGLDPNPICLAIHPWSPSVLFAGTRLEGIFRSTDGGAHWVPGNGLNHLEVDAFLIDPEDPDTFYMGTRRGLFVSRDAGVQWERIALDGKMPAVLTLVHDPLSKKVYAGTEKAGTFSTGDRGRTWKGEAQTFPDAASVNFIFRHPRVDYVASFGGLYRRNAEGRWSAIADRRFGYPQVLSVAVDAGDPPHLYVGAEHGVFESRNAGDTWEPLRGGIETVRIRGLLLAPGDPRTVYAATEKGFYRSTDAGNHWMHPPGSPDGIVTALILNPADPQNLFAQTSQGLYVTHDGGDRWTEQDFGGPFILLAMDPSRQRLLGTDGTGIAALQLIPAQADDALGNGVSPALSSECCFASE